MRRTPSPAALLYALLSSVSACSEGRKPLVDPVEVEIYAMAQCSFTAELLEQLLPVVRRLEDRVRLKVSYVGMPTHEGWQPTHGGVEAFASKLQLCAREDGERVWQDFMLCQVSQAELPPHNWKACAARSGIDEQKLSACAVSESANAILATEFAHSGDRGVTAAPELFIAGNRHDGGRSSVFLARALCKAMVDAPHPYCSQIPEPSPVSVTLLVDRRCKVAECETAPIIDFVKNTFASLKIREIDWDSADAQSLYHRTGLQFLPALIIAPEAKHDRWGFSRVAAAALPTREPELGFVIPLGDHWQPEAGRYLESDGDLQPSDPAAVTASASP